MYFGSRWSDYISIIHNSEKLPVLLKLIQTITPTAFLIVDLWPCRPMKNDLRICNDQPGLRYNTVCCPRSIKTVQWCMAHRHHWAALILGAQQAVLHLKILLTINIRIYYHPCNTSPTAIFSQRNEKISRTVSTAPHKCNTLKSHRSYWIRKS